MRHAILPLTKYYFSISGKHMANPEVFLLHAGNDQHNSLRLNCKWISIALVNYIE